MEYLLSGLEMAAFDRQTIEEYGVPGRALMEIAGRAVASTCLRLLRKSGRSGPVVIACGGGNNGGDGFVAARALAARGIGVQVFLFAERSRYKGDADAVLKTLEKSGEASILAVADRRQLMQFGQAVDSAAQVVDALLGIGLHNDVRGVLGEGIDLINQYARQVVSVDLPSGVDADTGAMLGRAVRAQHTVTFAYPKRGHYLHPGAELRGALTVADIGIPNKLVRQESNRLGRVLHLQDGPRLLQPRSGESHKGTFGHVVVVAGSPATPGAALLALRAALRSGAGLVSWSADAPTIHNAAARPSEIMLRLRDPGQAAPESVAGILHEATALVVGPGLGTTPERAALLQALLKRSEVPVCLDADALNLLAADPSLWSAVRTDTVLTPHPKEMARLMGSSVKDVQRDRFAAVSQLAMSRRCTVVLKGAGTVVGEPDGAVTLIGTGNPGLAHGGTGDVLAGIIGGMLAQRMDAATAAHVGALLHGAAGDKAMQRVGQAAMCASDVIDALGEVFRTWQR